MKVRTFLISYSVIFLITYHWLGERALGLAAPLAAMLSLERGKESLGERIAMEIVFFLFPPKYLYRYAYLIEPREGVLSDLSKIPSRGIVEVREEEVKSLSPLPFGRKVQKIFLYTKKEVSEWLKGNGIQFSRLSH